MTHEQFRSALDQHHAAVKATAGRAGFPAIVGSLSTRIEDLLVCAEDRGRMAREAADEGNFEMAMLHRKRSQSFIADARSLIDTPNGREAYRLYLERAAQ